MPRLFSVVLTSLSLPLMAHANANGDPLHDIAHLFEGAQIVDGPKAVDCTLSGGTETTCFSITVKSEPVNHATGPWCPSQVTDGPDKGGIWLEGGKVYDADGAFFSNLPELYNDQNWRIVDPDTGKLRVTDTAESCAAAARPDVAEEYQNHCVQCLPSYMPEDATITFVIPLKPEPQLIGRDIRQSGAGIALNGVRLDAPAPTDAILGAYTVAPFDDCGGHVNMHVGYHYHAVTDCQETEIKEGDHASVVGVAMDGYKIMARALADGTEPTDLDRCLGHDTDGEGYHYHAGPAGSNQIIGCHSAETGCVLNSPDEVCDASQPPKRP